jgi:NADH dehydrogenase [ubiquinone] 1 alpha subcomplex assembly factor 5
LKDAFLRDHPEQEFVNENGVKVSIIKGDEETIELEPDSFDACITSLSAHWINDLPGFFKRVSRCLKPDGAFIGALFGGDTLFELRSSFQLAELERQGGISPHVSPMAQPADIAGLLNEAKFSLVTLDVDDFVIKYPSPFELMADLQRMGESNAVSRRKPILAKDTLMAMTAIYQGKALHTANSRNVR